MTVKSNSQTTANSKVHNNKNTPQELIEEASKAGIINIATGRRGGVSERIIKDAVKTAKFLNQYFDEHPDE